MRWTSLIILVGLAGFSIAAAPHRAAAQMSPLAQPSEPSLPETPGARRRIEVNPRPLLYRRCVDWYELQYRPSGRMLFPQTRCWWVRG
jgi:hypothetical protein